MTAITAPDLGQIHALLAEKGYEVSQPAPDRLKITEVESGVTLQAVLQGDIHFLSLVCTVVPRAKITPEIMGPEDQDDILACVHFLLVDVLSARRLLGNL